MAYTIDEILERARRHLNIKVRYRLGGGKHVARGDDCLDDAGAADCSAFVLWCLGIDKYRPDDPALHPREWINTDVMCNVELLHLFVRTDLAHPGAVVVYPRRGPRYGHCGILTETPNADEWRIIHCSSGNFRRYGSAVRETELSTGEGGFLWRKNVRVLRPVGVAT